MARAGRIYYNNAVYHITIRGNNKQAVLKDEEDKKDFLKSLSRYRERFKFKLFGFVLMDNHAHLIIQTNGSINISRVMQALTLSYSQKFRHKYNYVGYVWQGRFRSNVIESENYILECLNYIHYNPLRAKIVEEIEDYTWSSYHFYNRNENPIAKVIEIDRLKV